MQIVYRAIAEDQPGPKWHSVYERHWHAYSRWFTYEGNRARPTYLACLRAIKTHMPELLVAFEKVATAAGGGDIEARFLSMWCPPFYIGGCSQAIVEGPPACLIRNYDFSPYLIEGTWLLSRFNGKRVLAMIDCLWGVLDGVNEDGLCVSLSFGGRTVVGQGFGIPILLRYVLEFAGTTAEAIAMLKRVPVHMAYTVAVIDRAGHHATLYLNPDRPAEIVSRLVSTNHQRAVEWARHAAATSSVERNQALEAVLRRSHSTKDILRAFLKPPTYQTAYGRGYGTLYTSFYRSDLASAELIWPSGRWLQSCTDFHEGVRSITYYDRNKE